MHQPVERKADGVEELSRVCGERLVDIMHYLPQRTPILPGIGFIRRSGIWSWRGLDLRSREVRVEERWSFEN